MVCRSGSERWLHNFSKIGGGIVKLSDLKEKNEGWFSRGNKKFFGDLWYRLLITKDGKYYLVRATTMRSNMICYRVNPILEDGKIGPLVNTIFSTYEAAKEFIKGGE